MVPHVSGLALSGCVARGTEKMVAHLKDADNDGTAYRSPLFCERIKVSDDVSPFSSVTLSHPGCPHQRCQL